MKKYSEAKRKFKKTSSHLRINAIQGYTSADFSIKQIRDTRQELALCNKLVFAIKEHLSRNEKESISEITFEND